ncbi:MAG: hypothetical protein ACQER4_00175 [Bacteroidota bacterium]
MIRLCIILLISFSLAKVGQAQQALFDEAAQELQSGDLERARSLFQQLETEGHHTPELFWNQAMVALESDSLGLAKYYLLRTSRFDHWQEKSEQALNHLEEMLARRSATLPPLPWNRLLLQLRDQPGADQLLWTSIILFHLLVILWIILQLKGRNSRAIRIGLYTATVFAFALLLSSAAIEWREVQTITGIQVGDQTPVYIQPDSTSAVIANLYEGYRVTFPDRSPASDTPFRFVRLENGRTGWVHPQQIRTYQGAP